MVRCAVLSCKNDSRINTKKSNNITYHALPKNDDRRTKWIEFINRPDWIPTDKTCICSAHFSTDSYSGTKNKLRILYEDACPTILPPLDSSGGASEDIREQTPESKATSEESESEIETNPKMQVLKCKIKSYKSLTIQQQKKIKHLQQSVRRYKAKVIDYESILKALHLRKHHIHCKNKIIKLPACKDE